MNSLITRPWFADPRILERTRQVARVFTSYGLGALAHHTGWSGSPRSSVAGHATAHGPPKGCAWHWASSVSRSSSSVRP